MNMKSHGFGVPFHRSSIWHLVSYRSESGREKYAEDEVRSEFKRRALPLVAERPPRDDWEWYYLMQHYGAPTRLLDCDLPPRN